MNRRRPPSRGGRGARRAPGSRARRPARPAAPPASANSAAPLLALGAVVLLGVGGLIVFKVLRPATPPPNDELAAEESAPARTKGRAAKLRSEPARGELARATSRESAKLRPSVEEGRDRRPTGSSLLEREPERPARAKAQASERPEELAREASALVAEGVKPLADSDAADDQDPPSEEDREAELRESDPPAPGRGGDEPDVAAMPESAAPFQSEPFRGWAKLSRPVAGSDFYRLSIYRRRPSGKIASEKAFLRIPKETVFLLDRRLPLEKLDVDEEALVLGRASSQEVDTRGRPGGLGTRTDRQIKNTLFLLAGESLEVNRKYRDRKDRELRWLEGSVQSTKGGLTLTFKGDDYRVTFGRAAPILRRAKSDRRALKKAKYIHFVGTTTDARPDTKSRVEAKRPSYEAERIIVLDAMAPRYATLLFP